jgi:hypothetical protein
LLAKRAIFILEVKNGHYVAVDTVSDPPLIFETDARFTHAIIFSEASLGQLGCPQGKCLEVREVRLRFASGKYLPVLPSQQKAPTVQSIVDESTLDQDDEQGEDEQMSDDDDDDYSGSDSSDSRDSSNSSDSDSDSDCEDEAEMKEAGEKAKA